MKHGERVLAAGETEHHLIALLNHVVLADGFSCGGLERCCCGVYGTV